MARRGFREGAVYKHKATGLWTGYVSQGFDSTGKRLRKFIYAKSKPEALRKMNDLRDLVKLDVSLLDETVSAYFQRWLNDSVRARVRPSTLAYYQDAVRNLIDPYVGSLITKNVTTIDIVTALSKMEADGKSPDARDRARSILRLGFGRAVRWKLIPSNPVDGVEAIRVTRGEMQCWGPDEVRQFLRAIRHHRLYPFVLMALSTGARQSELFGLCWDRVNLLDGIITIDRQLNRRTQTLTEVKTKLGNRTIKLAPMVLEALRERRARHLAEGHVLNPFVFVNNGGQTMKSSETTQMFKRLIKKAGMRPISIHGMRHSCASMLLGEGAPATDVAKLLGHHVSTTMETYAHALPKSEDRMAARMAEILTPPPEAATTTRPEERN